MIHRIHYFEGRIFDLTEFTLVLNEKKQKQKQSTTKHNTEIEVKGSDSLLTLFSRGPAMLLFDYLRGSFLFNIEKRRHLGNEQSDH